MFGPIGFCLFLLILSQAQISNQQGNRPRVQAPRFTSTSSSLFKYDCMRVMGWNIELPNGHIYIYCIWNANQAKTVSFDLLTENKHVTELEHSERVWRLVTERMKTSTFVSVCALKCNRGVPYPRFYQDGGVSEPDAVNVGCHDWSNLKCKASCPQSLFNVRNGNVICSEGAFTGSQCKLSCHVNFHPVGSNTRMCNPVTNQWQPLQPFKCQAFRIPSCPRLSPVNNGRLHCTHDNQLLSRCALTCRSGYVHVGPMIQWCLPDRNNTLVWYLPNKNKTNGPVTSRTGVAPKCRKMKYGLYEASTTNNTPVSPGIDRENSRRVEQISNVTYVLKRFDVCDVAPSKRIKCGLRTVTQSFCERRSCCWDSSQPNAPWCYKTALNPANGAVKTSRAPVEPSTSESAPTQYQPPSPTSTFSAASGVFRPYGGQFYNMPLRPHPITSFHCGCSSGIWSRCTSINSELTRRIYCGQNATAQDFPWNVLMYFKNSICGGTLVGNRYVLTAGHCIPDFEGHISQIRNNFLFFGLWNTSQLNHPGTQNRKIAYFVKHPNFTITSSASAINDIAIIKLNKAVQFTLSVQPLCLPHNEKVVAKDECVIMGFGQTSQSRLASTILQAASVPIITLLQCRPFFADNLISGQNICAGSQTRGTPDTCRGDSGGSLACRKKGSTGNCAWFLGGITSFGKSPCGAQNSPSVYVDVKHYQKWITTTIQYMDTYLP